MLLPTWRSPMIYHNSCLLVNIGVTCGESQLYQKIELQDGAHANRFIGAIEHSSNQSGDLVKEIQLDDPRNMSSNISPAFIRIMKRLQQLCPNVQVFDCCKRNYMAQLWEEMVDGLSRGCWHLLRHIPPPFYNHAPLIEKYINIVLTRQSTLDSLAIWNTNNNIDLFNTLTENLAGFTCLKALQSGLERSVNLFDLEPVLSNKQLQLESLAFNNSLNII